MIFNIALDDTIIPGKTVPTDIGLNIMFLGVFDEFYNRVICDSVTCDSITDWVITTKLHRKKHFNTNLTIRGTLLKNIFSNSVLVGVEVGDSITLRNHIFDKLTGSSL